MVYEKDEQDPKEKAAKRVKFLLLLQLIVLMLVFPALITDEKNEIWEKDKQEIIIGILGCVICVNWILIYDNRKTPRFDIFLQIWIGRWGHATVVVLYYCFLYMFQAVLITVLVHTVPLLIIPVVLLLLSTCFTGFKLDDTFEEIWLTLEEEEKKAYTYITALVQLKFFIHLWN